MHVIYNVIFARIITLIFIAHPAVGSVLIFCLGVLACFGIWGSRKERRELYASELAAELAAVDAEIAAAEKLNSDPTPTLNIQADPIPTSNNLAGNVADPRRYKYIRNIAVGVAATAALNNIEYDNGYTILKIDILKMYGTVDLEKVKEPLFARVYSPGIPNNLRPYDVFLQLCYQSNLGFSIFDLANFGTIGFDMGNVPPASLVQIEQATEDQADRIEISNLIASYVISIGEKDRLTDIWNDACKLLSRMLTSEAGMRAIGASEVLWLASFDDVLAKPHQKD